jgi:hypothetical protein
MLEISRSAPGTARDTALGVPELATGCAVIRNADRRLDRLVDVISRSSVWTRLPGSAQNFVQTWLVLWSHG